MARLISPSNTTQCNCGSILRIEEMIRDQYYNNDYSIKPETVSYLLCPQCELALFMEKTETETETECFTSIDSSHVMRRQTRTSSRKVLLKMDDEERRLREWIKRG